MTPSSVREIYVDSRRRNENEHGNAYTLFIQTPLKNVNRVDLVAATIPNTMYNITNGANIFSISSTKISIANGFYSASSLACAVNSSMGGMPKMIFLGEEGKFMIYSNVSSFNLNVLSSEFSAITNIHSGNSKIASPSTGIYCPCYAGVNFVKSSNVANFKTCGEYIYLDIDELRRPFSIDAVTNVYNSQSSAIFAVVPLDVSSGCIKTFKEYSDYKISVEYPKPIDQIDRLTITWRDYEGKIINFNGVDENSLILRFYEAPLAKPPTSIKEQEDEQPIKKIEKDKKMVFFILVVALIFILFIKRK
jgi:hypothetical protein